MRILRITGSRLQSEDRSIERLAIRNNWSYTHLTNGSVAVFVSAVCSCESTVVGTVPNNPVCDFFLGTEATIRLKMTFKISLTSIVSLIVVKGRLLDDCVTVESGFKI